MSRRTVTLLVAGIGVIAAALVAALVPVPYVILSPGPTLNTLGKTSGGPLISIAGHPHVPDLRSPQPGDGLLPGRSR